MSKKIDDGGPAFPVAANEEFAAHDGMTLRQWYATHAPRPDQDRVVSQYKQDRNRNPHNEPGKPPIRSESEIIADLAFEYADAMIKAGAK